MVTIDDKTSNRTVAVNHNPAQTTPVLVNPARAEESKMSWSPKLIRLPTITQPSSFLLSEFPFKRDQQRAEDIERTIQAAMGIKEAENFVLDQIENENSFK